MAHGSIGGRRSRVATAARWLLVLSFVAVGFWSVTPSRALPTDASERSFSAVRAMGHVERIAREPHPMGSQAIAVVRRYIVSELEKIGLEPELQRSTVPDYYGSAGAVEIVNVIARIPGTAGTRAMVLVAHYDTVPTTPGANDDSAAVAALLETARALLSREPVENDTILLFTDGEEPAPRFGARAFLERHPAAGEVGFVVNFEAAGGSGPSMLVETSGPESRIVEEFAAAVAHPVAFSFVAEIVEMIGGIGTDFDPFRESDVPGIHVAYLRGSSIYHTAADDVRAVSATSLQHHGDQAMGLVRHFGHLDLATIPEDRESIYFTVGPLFVTYPSAWSIALALAAAVLFGGALRRSRIGPGPVAIAAGRTLLGVLCSTLAATAAWMLVATIRTSPSVIEGYVDLVVLVVLAAAIERKLTASTDPGARAFGVVLLWAILALLTAAAAPRLSYLFVWPALAATIVLVWRPGRGLVLPGYTLVAAPALILIVPAVEFFFQMGQPRPGNPDSSMPAVAAIAILLAALVDALLRGAWVRALGSPAHLPPCFANQPRMRRSRSARF